MPIKTTTLLAGAKSDGTPVFEEVVVEPLEGGVLRVLRSPGLVLGVAAGDEIGVDAERRPTILRRGGNLCVQVFTKNVDWSEVARTLSAELSPLGGRLDGEKPNRLLVYTVPAKAGLPTVERVLDGVVTRYPGLEWSYGNVYDPKDGVTPLNWWLPSA